MPAAWRMHDEKACHAITLCQRAPTMLASIAGVCLWLDLCCRDLAPRAIDAPWVRVSFVFSRVGYGLQRRPYHSRDEKRLPCNLGIPMMPVRLL